MEYFQRARISVTPTSPTNKNPSVVFCKLLGGEGDGIREGTVEGIGTLVEKDKKEEEEESIPKIDRSIGFSSVGTLLVKSPFYSAAASA